MFSLAYHHKYPNSEIENKIPFERDIIIKMVSSYMEELEQERRNREQ